MNSAQAKELNAQIDRNSQTFRRVVRGFCEPPKAPLAEKILSIEGAAVKIRVGDASRIVRPKIDVIRADDNIIFASQNITEAQLRKLINPTQKSDMTKAFHQDLEQRKLKLTHAKN